MFDNTSHEGTRRATPQMGHFQQPTKRRDRWGSRLGVIMAVAGSAIGLGNFLRFPVQAAGHGGGAFMIPYFISLFLLGLPLMWIEWTIGRFGGGFGHGTAPGAFQVLWQKNRFIKYFGVIGIVGPLIIFAYYTYIESWLLGYTVFASTGHLSSAQSPELMRSFLSGYQGLEQNQFFQSMAPAYVFFLITFGLNFWVISHGISRGIERLTRFTMPLLLGLAILMAVRVLTLGSANPAHPEWTAVDGLGFLWNPDFSALRDADVWLAAAGQVFFTLSVGIGCILTYASYLSNRDDVALSGLSGVSINELAEVILGGSIIIPAAFIFFGPQGIGDVAQSGAFDLGFVTMPIIFLQMAGGRLMAIVWFALLFLAGITSSVSLAQPAIAFLEDEFNISRRQAVGWFGIVAFLCCQPAIFFLSRGVVDELDFWGGTFCLVVFATVETILFAWVFGIDRAWEEMHRGADIRVPRIYKFIIKYVTPLFLLGILGAWFYQQGWPTIMMRNVSADNQPYVMATRAGLALIMVAFMVLVRVAWQKRAAGHAATGEPT